jgi:hypothetical protein
MRTAKNPENPSHTHGLTIFIRNSAIPVKRRKVRAAAMDEIILSRRPELSAAVRKLDC